MAVRTGREYLEALRDGRRVWQGGRRIEDVPSHPGFSGTAQTLARLYDAQGTPELLDRLTVDWEGERISYRYHPPTSAEDLARKRSHTEYWAEETLGQMGRLPDYCAEMTVGLLDAAGFLQSDGADHARAYHRYAAERDLSLTHALNDQFYDRRKRVSEQADPDLVLHVVRETSDGPIVRGLRNLATMAPLCDEVLVHPNAPRAADEADYAICFALPMNAPGLQVVCRDLYAEHADPERLPLTARFDEVDATLIFDDVLVPWERVFVYREPALAQRYHATVLLWAAWVSTVRLLTKLRFYVGVAQLLLDWSGRQAPVQLGRLLQDVEILRACLVACEAEGYRKPSGLWAPRLNEAHRLHGIEASDRAEHLLEQMLTSLLIQTGGPSDLAAPEVGPLVERYFRGGAPSTPDHLRLLAVAADLVQSAFANRNQLYERLWGGEPDVIRQRLHRNSDLSAFTGPVLCFIRDRW